MSTKYTINSVYDSKSELYGIPFVMKNRAVAIRSFQEAVNKDKQSQFHRFPSDYTLFEIGSWSDDGKEMEFYPTPVSLGLAIEHLVVEN